VVCAPLLAQRVKLGAPACSAIMMQQAFLLFCAVTALALGGQTRGADGKAGKPVLASRCAQRAVRP
jgi:hypothetical protein